MRPPHPLPLSRLALLRLELQRLVLSLGLGLVIVCLVSLASPTFASPALSFTLLAEPQVSETKWGLVSGEHGEPIWFSFILRDKRLEPLQRTRVKLSCLNSRSTPQHSVSLISDHNGLVTGALPLDCLRQREEPTRLKRQRWLISVAASEQVVEWERMTSFEPSYLRGTWRFFKVQQRADELRYELRHNLKVTHRFKAIMALRPCLEEELQVGRPLSLPGPLLEGQLAAQGHSLTTLSTESLEGLRRVSLRELKAPAGCYVLSARSPVSPWAQLLEARALIWLRAPLKVELGSLHLDDEAASVSGVASAAEGALLWSPLTLASALSELKISARLSAEPLEQRAEGLSSTIESIALSAPPSWREREEGEGLDLIARWRARVPFPQAQEGRPSPLAHQLSLHWERGQLSLGGELLGPADLKPQPMSLLRALTLALSYPESWLALLALWLMARGTRRRRGSAHASEGLSALPELLSDPPRPITLHRPAWSPAPALEEALRSESLAQVGLIELLLFDVETGAQLLGPPSLALSTPERALLSAEPPGLEPERPVRGLEPLGQGAEGLRVSLSAELCEALARGEERWLWVGLSGYEGCVISLSSAQLTQRLKLPLWNHRAALKRQLGALTQRRELQLSFGHSAIEALREQLQEPRLCAWLTRAEASLYNREELSASEALSIAWGLAEGHIKGCLSPHDIRVARPNDARPLAPAQRALPLQLLLSLALGASLLAPHKVAAESGDSTPQAERSFRSLIELVSESCEGSVKLRRELSLTELMEAERVVLLDPIAVPSELLELSKRGARLLIALEPAAAERSERFLARLDLKRSPPELDSSHELVSGIWWAEEARDQAHLPPFVGVTMTQFIEGPSWYRHEINPTWLDERGRSLGYRVKVGRGSIFLFGDADAISDRLISVASNQLSALTFVEWLLHGESTASCPLILAPPGLITDAPSLEYQAQSQLIKELLHQARDLLAKALGWFKRHLNSQRGAQLLLALLLSLWVAQLSRARLKG